MDENFIKALLYTNSSSSKCPIIFNTDDESFLDLQLSGLKSTLSEVAEDVKLVTYGNLKNKNSNYAFKNPINIIKIW